MSLCIEPHSLTSYYYYMIHILIYLYSALEDSMPEEAIQLYTDAYTILEDDGREQMAFDLYRAATNVYVKLEK